MKTKIGILVLAFSASFFSLQAQRSFRTTTTTRAMSYDISDNLDLDAVASIFGDSENLEDFEHRLNDPDNRISNLDLNEDGYVDYLRVIENSSERNSLVVVQAVLDKNIYQDVATIEIERVPNGNPRIQIVGDVYLYGTNYIIEPAFVRTPLIFSFFWGPRHTVWNSPYSWSSYPGWYHTYRPYSPFKYHRRIYENINRYNTYHRASERYHYFSEENYNHIRRNDYATRYPDRAFSSRNEGLRNTQELYERRPERSVYDRKGSDNQRSNDRRYEYNRNSTYGNERPTIERSVSPTQPTPSTSGRSANQVNPITTRSYERPNTDLRRSQTPREDSSNQRNVEKPNSSNGSVLIKTENRNEPAVQRSVPQSQETPTRSGNRVESTKQRSEPSPAKKQREVRREQRSEKRASTSTGERAPQERRRTE